ncbi:MAG: DUF4097 family beta strand repeat protein [Streptomycetaceae bacterium]|nr:DUF4097 family beta strand repeat protein [Streptomycetaceae bacterium]
MPKFATPDPISLDLAIDAGAVRIIAEDRTDTVVDVRPSGSRDADAKAADQTRVAYSRGRLTVHGPKQRQVFTRGGSVNVTVELPAGSHVRISAAMAAVRGEGRLGEVAVETSAGAIQLDRSDALHLRTSHGHITVDGSTARADIATSHGDVTVSDVAGDAVVKTSNGATRIGAVGGELRVSAANGDITVAQADANVHAKTARGDIRIGEVVRDAVVLETAHGEIEVGIRPGSAAWLDASTGHGTVRSTLSESDGPETADETVEVRAHTSVGDIVVRRSAKARAGLGY